MMRAPRDSFPVLMSSSLSPGTVIAVATNALATAMSPPVIDASRDSAIHMADPAQAELVDIGGVLATPYQSIWQIDGVALRLRMPVAWALRSPTALAWMSDVTW